MMSDSASCWHITAARGDPSPARAHSASPATARVCVCARVRVRANEHVKRDERLLFPPPDGSVCRIRALLQAGSGTEDVMGRRERARLLSLLKKAQRNRSL